MAGANYMGGKRNAARARVKDAAGKAQRSHFGKKRFEVLRTGLSKGGIAKSSKPRNAVKERPEISLAHARWPQHESKQGFVDQKEDVHGLRSPFASPVSLRRSPPVPSSASSRSRILRALDAESRSCGTAGAGAKDSPDAEPAWPIEHQDAWANPLALC
ncbi:hypothetical protein L226DRAFT_56940 [Lentinus tigrinus ALCF2SS1-7]|uniref:Uncharacterized protein n=1 Tax=Lentinus tigrinus ALCF2SS1-6 TaxID=1328759 RepID=A0A5C2SBR6_9APHY|nr:hypothetical protein L227DRAFT_76271 [Lentinus tigrinus ALCF2SS1-6]RPD75189.1 hypothetical protein L226DRAFT_56940 [Lentinus tigrinus ALCF2SS1-7]